MSDEKILLGEQVDQTEISQEELNEAPAAVEETEEVNEPSEIVDETEEEVNEPSEIVDETEEEVNEPSKEAEETAEEETEPSEEADEAAEEENEPSETVEETAAVEPENEKNLPYHQRYYLHYHKGKRSSAMDLDGTKAFLQRMGYDGGELRQAREGKYSAELFQNAGKTGINQLHCSYCGCEISGVSFFRTPDGRLRCTTCSNSVVKSKTEVQELCRRVLVNMENFFGASITKAVSIEMVEERKLKRKIGVPLGTRDDQSMLILGVAVNKKGKYSLILENGAPRISLIATFAHELTHIWQYIHWDDNKAFKKCSPDKRLLIYEGMAKWVEIQYLYLIGETAVARREEAKTRNREDEYGIGFCLYEDRYPLSRDVMNCQETPFTTDSYPLG